MRIIFCEYDRKIDIHLTFAADFARRLGTYKERDK